MKLSISLPAFTVSMPPFKQTVILLIIAQSLLGMAIMIYGAMSPVVDLAKAEEMLLFVEKNNPEYYTRLTDTSNDEYLKEFYDNYSEYGNKRIILFGLFFTMIAVNMAIPMLYALVSEKKTSMKKTGGEEGDGENPDGMESEDEEDDDELF